jgi:hypothetical protein
LPRNGNNLTLTRSKKSLVSYRLLYWQVDDLALACSDPSMAQVLIDSFGKIVDLKSQGILNSFSAIAIDQRREYVKVSRQSYLARMLKAHGRDNLPRPRRQIPSPSSRLLRLHRSALNLSRTSRRQSRTPNPWERNRFQLPPGARRTSYAYVVGRVGISYAVILLTCYSFAPDRCHYLALKRLCKYIRRTIDWGILYWR